jgi:hypothetical protein
MMPSGISSPAAVEDRVVGHQVADVAHEQQAAPGEVSSPPSGAV